MIGLELTLTSLKLRPELKRQENEETVIVTKWMLTKDDKEIGTVFNEGYMKTFTETWTLDAAGTEI